MNSLITDEKGMCVRCSVLYSASSAIIHNDNLVCAVLTQCICKSLHTGTNKNSSLPLCPNLLQGPFPCDQFQSDSAQFIINLLGEDKYALIILIIFILNLHYCICCIR